MVSIIQRALKRLSIPYQDAEVKAKEMAGGLGYTLSAKELKQCLSGYRNQSADKPQKTKQKPQSE